MKFGQILFLGIVLLGVYSCAKDELPPQVLKTSEQELHFSGQGGEWLLTINSNAVWQVSGETAWCTVSQTEGKNTDQLVITVGVNTENQIRSTRLHISGDRSQSTLVIQQDTNAGYQFYELPVVFHIIYSEISDTTQNIKAGTVTSLIDQCNKVYNDNGMDLKLVAATMDPEGNVLEVPGIHRVLKSTSAYQSCSNFMKEDNTKDADLLWNPNRYVNVYVYKFTENNTLGISHLPYTPRQSSLTGLNSNNYYFTHLPGFPYGISLNNTYIYEPGAYTTLAHELGHYLGLYHVFLTKACDATDETDYCEDTYSYYRPDYEKLLIEKGDSLTIEEKVMRTTCDGMTFISFNVMDYEVSYMNQFTPEQYKRVRHVLEHSPLIPGPKSVLVTKGWAEETERPRVVVME